MFARKMKMRVKEHAIHNFFLILLFRNYLVTDKIFINHIQGKAGVLYNQNVRVIKLTSD